MGFADEVAEKAVPTGRPNVFDRFIDSQPDADEIREALADPSVSVGAICRALQARGFTGHESTVMRHARYARTGR